MRNLIWILALSLTALAVTRAAGMGFDHAGGTMPAAMAEMDAHARPACPNDALSDAADNAACGDCTACGTIAPDLSHPTAQPVAITVSPVGTLRVAPDPTGRVDIDDPPPPRV